MFAMPAWPIVAVLDTNVVIVGLLWERPPRSLLAQGQTVHVWNRSPAAAKALPGSPGQGQPWSPQA